MGHVTDNPWDFNSNIAYHTLQGLVVARFIFELTSPSKLLMFDILSSLTFNEVHPNQATTSQPL